MTDNLHNKPPPYDAEKHEELAKQITELNDKCGDFLSKKEITTATESAKLTDLITAARKIGKDVEAQRKADKEPWKERADLVDRAFGALNKRVDKIAATLKDLQGEFLKRQAAEERRRKEEAEQEARRAAEEAEAKMRAAESRLDVAGMADAEAAMEEAARKAKEAAKDKRVSSRSFTGGGRTMSLVKVRHAKLVDDMRGFLRYRNHPEIIEKLEQLATREAREAKTKELPTIPGFEIYEKEQAR